METDSRRPSRSDAHLSKEEEAKIEGETRDYFDDLAPKRHTKPQRSEYAAQYVDGLPDDQDDGVTPEYVQFQHLEQNSEKIVYTGNKVSEEFVETEYYKDLNGVDKQHHTTGTGFIKVDGTNEADFNLVPEVEHEHHASSKGNPATNEWTPTPADTASFVGKTLPKSELETVDVIQTESSSRNGTKKRNRKREPRLVFNTIPLNRFVVCSQGTTIRNSIDVLPDLNTCPKDNWNSGCREQELYVGCFPAYLLHAY